MLPLEAYAMLTELSEFHIVSRSTIAHRLIYAEFLRTLSRVDPEKAKEMEKEFEARFHNPVIERVEWIKCICSIQSAASPPRGDKRRFITVEEANEQAK